MKIEKPDGVYESVPDAEYRSWKGLSASMFKGCNGNALKLHADATNQTVNIPTDAMILGTAFHTHNLEPEKFGIHYLKLPADHDGRKKEGKERNARVKKQGLIPLKHADFEMLEVMKASLNSSLWWQQHFDPKKSIELSVVTTVNGVKLKSRIDYYNGDNDGLIIDLKSAKDASESAWQKQFRYEGAITQASIYVNMLRAHGMPCARFVFAPVEKTPPYVRGFWSVAESDIVTEWGKVTDMIDRYKTESSGVWKHYSDEPVTLQVNSLRLR